MWTSFKNVRTLFEFKVNNIYIIECESLQILVALNMKILILINILVAPNMKISIFIDTSIVFGLLKHQDIS